MTLLLRLLLAALGLVAALATPATAAQLNVNALPAEFYSNSVYEFNVYSGVAPSSDVRISLDCGPAVEVSPPNGLCITMSGSYRFTLRTFANASDAACVYTLHQEEPAFFDPLLAQLTDPVVRPVRNQRTLSVTPASTAQAPIVVGRYGVASLTFTLTEDLVYTQQIDVQCSNLASASGRAVGLQSASNPVTAAVTMGATTGFVACNFAVFKTNDQNHNEIDTASAGWAFFQIVESVQLAATGMPLAASVLAGDLPDAVSAVTPYALSVAPPATPQAFDLTLTCVPSDGSASFGGSLTFTAETTAAQTLTIDTPTAPGANSGVIVSCTWASTSSPVVRKTMLPPPTFSFYLGSDVVVSASAETTQLNATTATSVITVSVPAETVFSSNVVIEAQCSAGSLSNTAIQLMHGQLSATTTYTAAPTAAASTPQCTFTVRQDAGSEYRRVKAAIAPITFNVAAAVVKQQLVVKGLPTAADTISVTEVSGMVSQAAATAGVTITLSAPTGMAAGSSVVTVLSCTAELGAVAAVTPAQQTFTPQSTGPAAFIVNVTAPTEPNAQSTMVSCSWGVGDGSTQSEVDRLDAPQDFSFMVGTAVQLEVVPNVDSYSFDYAPVGSSIRLTLQTAGNGAALVGGQFQLAVSCTPCGGAGVHTGEGYMSNSEWTISTESFPKSSPIRPEFEPAVTGVVTCHWSMPAGSPWSRAFLAPVATVFTVVPRAMLEVMGLPTAADVIPRTSKTKVYSTLRQPGDQVTISMPAAPADFNFGPTWVNFTLRCSSSATDSDLVLSNDGRFHYSATSRGAQSVVITMPNVTDDRPTQIDCSFERAGMAPLLIEDNDYEGYMRFNLAVANAWTTLTMVEPSTSPVVGGAPFSVWFEPSRTIRMPGSRLIIQVQCTYSTQLPRDIDSRLMVSSITSVGSASVYAYSRDMSKFNFRSQYTSTLTANATDPNLRFGYKITAPKAPMTIVCTHALAVSSTEESAYADRFIRLAPTQPVVFTVLPPLNITVSGVPSAPLSATPGQQMITVQPIIRVATDFPAGETLVIRLDCPGLTLTGNELTFTGTGESATVAAQSISFTLPNATAGSGNVWQCTWSKSGTAGERFPQLQAFSMVVGTPITWSVQLYNASTLYPGWNQAVRGVLTPSACLPSQGYLYTQCDGGVASMTFVASGWEGSGFIDDNFGLPLASFPFFIQPSQAGTFECRVTVQSMEAGAGVTVPSPIAFTALQRASMTVTGAPALDEPLVMASTSHTLTVAPSVAPGTGGVTVRLICNDGRVTVSPSRLYFPAGLVAAQTFALNVPADTYLSSSCYWRIMEPNADCGSVAYGCAWSSYDRNHFEAPQQFQLLAGAQKAISVGGADAQGNVATADVCADLSFTIAPSVAPAAGTSIVLRVDCDSLDLEAGMFTFTAESPQAQTVIVRAPGSIATRQCNVFEEQNQYVEKMVQVTFGAPSALTSNLPTFVPRGAVVPFELTTPVAVPYGSWYINFYPSCTFGGMVPSSMYMENGAKSVASSYWASNDRPRDIRPDLVISHVAQPMSDDSATENSEASQSQDKNISPKERHAQRQRAARAAAAAIAIGVADSPAADDSATGDLTVTCTWDMRGSISQRFTLAPTITFIVGTPVNLTVMAADAAETPVTQGASVALTVSPSAAVAVDVEMNVACPTGITPSPATFTMMAGSTFGQLVLFAAAADSQLGAAQCTLTSSGPGRMAVTTTAPIALNVVEPSSGADSSSSSSSTGQGPCVDAECGAFAAASLPSLAALAAMMMAAAFAQRQ